jgi:hypothetical protein
LLAMIIEAQSTVMRGGYFKFSKQYIESAPIAPTGDQVSESHMLVLTDRMLDLHLHLSTVQSSHDRTLIQRQIEATDREIDRLVYELYELTPAEIAVVEGR